MSVLEAGKRGLEGPVEVPTPGVWSSLSPVAWVSPVGNGVGHEGARHCSCLSWHISPLCLTAQSCLVMKHRWACSWERKRGSLGAVVEYSRHLDGCTFTHSSLRGELC